MKKKHERNKVLDVIQKRDGTIVPFDQVRITNAIRKAGKETKEFDESVAKTLSDEVVNRLQSRTTPQLLTVEYVQDIVEQVLLDSSFKQTAKAYILYREKRAQMRRPDIFKKRFHLKPHEYPHLAEYVDAIRHSYWIHTEFNFTSDIQDFKVKADTHERETIKRAMLAIAQIEVAVKTFWGDIFKHIPKPEIGSVGYTFAESEVRHHDAYSHLLDILGLNHEFETIYTVTPLFSRIRYLEKALVSSQSYDKRDFILSLALFSIFIEHISLFSQFLIMMSFNKHRNAFKGISNAVEATSKEEQIHGLFGIHLINVIRDEHPEFFDPSFYDELSSLCKDAYNVERDIVQWMLEDGDLSFLTQEEILQFVQSRINNDMQRIGGQSLFVTKNDIVAKTNWFDDEIIGTKHTDFFVKRSINYSKRTRSITEDDLF